MVAKAEGFIKMEESSELSGGFRFQEEPRKTLENRGLVGFVFKGKPREKPRKPQETLEKPTRKRKKYD